MRDRAVVVLVAAALGACSHKEAAAPPPPAPTPAVVYAALPTYATPGMLIPARLADGGYPTPNQGLTGDAALWHLRAALNVAALSCPGEQGLRLTAAYNAWIKAAARPLAAAHKALSKAPGFDDAQTRLYNYYAQLPARPAFCAAAEAAVASSGTPDRSVTQAPATLAALDRPFTDFYRAYDAWRNHEPVTPLEQPQVILATVAAADVQASPAPARAPVMRPVALASAKPMPRGLPRIEVDPSLFRE